MGRMEFKGIDQRASEARATLNRLHTEIYWRLEQGEELLGTGMDVAEVLAIAVQIGKLIDEHLPAGDPRRNQFEMSLQFMTGFHEVPR